MTTFPLHHLSQAGCINLLGASKPLESPSNNIIIEVAGFSLG